MTRRTLHLRPRLLRTAWPALAAVGLLVGATPASAASSTTFSFTGSSQAYVVPSGTNALSVKAVGATGGNAQDTSGNYAAGGRGSVVQSTIPVTPGQTLYIYVGGNGASGDSSGGYNGGGGSPATSNSDGGSGGGASDIRTTQGDLSSRILVAGGGGGAGYNDGGTPSGGNGGFPDAGGGGNFEDAYYGIFAYGAGGASQTSGGAAGASNASGYPNGSAGALGQGGSGTVYDGYFSGGGGGGGLYGGGGGSVASGGGGGSDYLEPGAYGTTYDLDTTASPEVVITPEASQISASPNSLGFGPQPLNETASSTSGTYRVDISTPSGEGPTVFTDSISGPDAGDFSLAPGGDGCGAGPVPSGASCTLTVQYTPTQLGPEYAEMDVDSSKGVYGVYLTGTGETNAAFSASTSSLAFGDQSVGSSSGGQIVTVTNPGQASLSLGQVTLAGADPNQFSIASDSCSNQSVVAGGSCSVTVQFSPSSLGSETAELSFPNDGGPDGSSRTDSTALSGTGQPTPASIQTSPAYLDFGNQDQGTGSAARTVTVENTGDSVLSVAYVYIVGSLPGPGLPGQQTFSVVSDGCSNQSLSTGDSCSVSVEFSPGSNASFLQYGELAIASNASNAFDGTTDVPISGIALTPAAMTLSDSTLSFSDQDQATSSPAKDLVVTNTGQDSLELGSVVLGGSNPHQFAITSDGCSNQTLTAYQTCSLVLQFAPTASARGPQTAQLSVPSNASHGSTQTVGLAGVATEPAVVALTPVGGGVRGDFGNQDISTRSATQTVTIQNNGDDPLDISSVELGGADPDQFSIQADPCSGTTLAGGGSCTVAVAFAPTSRGEQQASLDVYSNSAQNSPSGYQSVAIQGVGTEPAVLQLTPSSHDFGAVAEGGRQSETFTATNGGDDPLTVSDLRLEGPGGAQYSITDDGCSQSSLAGGATCTFKVTFSPSQEGEQSANLTIDSDASNGSAFQLTLSGDGLSAPHAGATVASRDFGVVTTGSTSAQLVTVTNSGDLDLALGMVSLGATSPGQYSLDPAHDSCSGRSLANGASCTFRVTFAPTADGSQSATVTVASNDPTSPLTIHFEGTGATPSTVAPAAPSTAPSSTATTIATVPLTTSLPGTAKIPAVLVSKLIPPPHQTLDGLIKNGERLTLEVPKAEVLQLRSFVYERALTRGYGQLHRTGGADRLRSSAKVYISKMVRLTFAKAGTQTVVVPMLAQYRLPLRHASSIILGVHVQGIATSRLLPIPG